MKNNKTFFLIIVELVVVLALGIMSVRASGDLAPSFSVTDVMVDESVSILTRDFPAQTEFTVRMKDLASIGDFVDVARFNSQAGGSFAVTFPIPEELFGVRNVSMTLTDGKGLSITGSFSITVYEETLPVLPEVTIEPIGGQEIVLQNPVPVATVVPQNEPIVLVNPIIQQPVPVAPRRAPCNRCAVPMFKIVGVVKNQSVEVETLNFPLQTDFIVRMGYFSDPKTCTPMGCFIPSEMGPDKIFVGFEAGTYSSGNNVSERATFQIPAAIKHMSPLYVRFDEVCGGCGYYSFNYFWNNNYPVK